MKKATSRNAVPSALAAVSSDERSTLGIISIGRRLKKIRAALVVIKNSCRLEDSELMHAITEIAEIADDEAYWISLLPGRVLNLPAPTDDDVEQWSKDRSLHRKSRTIASGSRRNSGK